MAQSRAVASTISQPRSASSRRNLFSSGSRLPDFRTIGYRLKEAYRGQYAKKDFGAIGETIKRLCQAGVLSFEDVSDASAVTYDPGGWDDLAGFLRQVPGFWRRDLRPGQPVVIEVITEAKETLGLISRLGRERGVLGYEGKVMADTGCTGRFWHLGLSPEMALDRAELAELDDLDQRAIAAYAASGVDLWSRDLALLDGVARFELEAVNPADLRILVTDALDRTLDRAQLDRIAAKGADPARDPGRPPRHAGQRASRTRGDTGSMNEQADREQALRSMIWKAGYELIGPRHENFGGGYAIMNASEDPKPEGSITWPNHFATFDDVEAWTRAWL